MALDIAFVSVLICAMAGLAVMARRDHRAVLAGRAGLLDPLVALFPGASVSLAADGFPVLTSRLADRRLIRIELIPDTLVMRRLPQLWLIVTLSERVERPRASIGALSRPTGAEFYSRVHEFPERIESPAGLDPGILLRGEGRIAPANMRRFGPVLAEIFADPQVKEVAATPRGVRLVRQVCEGARGSHLLLRQSRFALRHVAPETVTRAIAAADGLRTTLDASGERLVKLSA